MEPGFNCSDLCDSYSSWNSQARRQRTLRDLCTITITAYDSGSQTFPSSSAALLGVVWTFLTGGVLLALFFLVFTIHVRKNRIVKMSSPNLNIVTLLGSGLTYTSAYLFGIPEQSLFSGASMEMLIQVRLCLLCVGSSLVFGPILGKSWRLYKVFTQRGPEKRVIIKDLQLLVMVVVLVLADAMLLTTWIFSDPVQCFQSFTASLRVTDKGMTCSVGRMQFCASLYSELWLSLILGFKSILLIYGTYLAGLTDHVSAPPVNQSLILIVGVNLIFLAAGTVFLVNWFFYTWHNLVFGFTSGGIFICTTTINCFIFVPQLRQWKVFEEEQNQTISHMAKYFTSPSKSFLSMYSEEQICQLIGEKNSMQRLLTEKNAVIESLQEQVNNAKEKLTRLMSAECSYDSMGLAVPSTSFSILPQNTDSHVESSGCAMEAEGLHGDYFPPGQEQNPWHCPSLPDTQCSPVSVGKQDCVGIIQNLKHIKHQNTPPEDLSCYETLLCNPMDISEYSSKDVQEQWRPSNNKKYIDSPPIPLSQNLSAVDGRAEQPESSAAIKEQASKVSEKLQEILQELSIGGIVSAQASPRGPRQPSHNAEHEKSAAWRPWESHTGVCTYLSPYRTRRRRRRIPVHPPSTYFPASMTPQAWCLTNKAVSRTQSGQSTWSRDRLTQTSPDKASDTGDGRFLCQPSPSSSVIDKMCNFQLTHRKNWPEEQSREGNGQVSNKHQGSAQVKNHDALLYPPSPLSLQQQQGDAGRDLEQPLVPSLCLYPDSDSSSSSEEMFSCCHKPHCEICFPSPGDSSDSCTTDTDPEPAGSLARWAKLYGRPQPVVNFKDDLKPTLV
ncbi:probable G-protein coupled receptor 156 isoform X1 [Chelonia mydas]|uniref:probable G-protein coupled receptor 156 isoform X1 n=1 Tax=Chelonia mydas TaxID=8469 RepID=UPI0018A1E9F6|nr:probable G-protein coupled receptor 156 isoform X1 [Chelonia mydas]XP_043394670.1 probable G-protein coupled receptor 156 isoform X1 [Chelonia mydas]